MCHVAIFRNGNAPTIPLFFRFPAQNMNQSTSANPGGYSLGRWNPLRMIRHDVRPESIYFFTFHKCASTLFSSYVLKNIQGLEHVDYAQQDFEGQAAENSHYEPRGHAYGPIRLSRKASTDAQLYDKLVSPLIQRRFIRKRIALVLVRDPRDIAISYYYSLGFSHVLSPIEKVRGKQLEQRRRVSAMTLDEYVISDMPWIVRDFALAEKLLGDCSRATLLKYEDMILNWDRFARDLTRHITLEDDVLDSIYEQSRPRDEEDIMAHRRSGKTEGFREKLKPETIMRVNETLVPVFERFGYRP